MNGTGMKWDYEAGPDDSRATTATATRQDIRVEKHGSLYLVYGLTAGARTWLVENTQDDAIWWGDSLVVEGNYFPPLFDAMADAGLIVR